MAESQRIDLHEWLLDRYGPKGESLYMLANGLVAISVNGFAALLLNQPLLFPSLSPTVFTLFRQPLTPQASPRNTIVGHFVAITVGFFFLLVFGLSGEPSVLQEGVTLARIGAAALSVAVMEALLILIRTPHTPAGTTTLLVSLWLFTTERELISLAAGIVLLTVVCWIINRSFGAPVPVWGPEGQEKS